MTGADDGRLLALARDVLDLAAQVLTDAGTAAPDRRYVAPGQVSAPPGCDALFVVIDRVYAGQPGVETRTVPVNCAQPLTAQLRLVLHRCVPTIGDGGDWPATSVVDGAGAGLVGEGWALLLGVQSALATRPGGGGVVGLAGPLETLRPEGGVGGWQLTVNARV